MIDYQEILRLDSLRYCLKQIYKSTVFRESPGFPTVRAFRGISYVFRQKCIHPGR